MTTTAPAAVAVHDVEVTDFTRARIGIVQLQSALAAHLPGATVRARVDAEFPDDLTITVAGATEADVDDAAHLYLASTCTTYRIDTHGDPT